LIFLANGSAALLASGQLAVRVFNGFYDAFPKMTRHRKMKLVFMTHQNLSPPLAFLIRYTAREFDRLRYTLHARIRYTAREFYPLHRAALTTASGFGNDERL
jgi:hypothetical protein